MKPTNKRLRHLSESSKKKLKLILEEKSEEQFQNELDFLKILAKQMEMIELSNAELLELYLEVVLWTEKIRQRRRGIWDDDFESYEETPASELGTRLPLKSN